MHVWCSIKISVLFNLLCVWILSQKTISGLCLKFVLLLLFFTFDLRMPAVNFVINCQYYYHYYFLLLGSPPFNPCTANAPLFPDTAKHQEQKTHAPLSPDTASRTKEKHKHATHKMDATNATALTKI